MNVPQQLPPIEISPGIFVLPAVLPIADLGWLPVSSFLIRGAQPVLIDCGILPLKDDLLASLTGLIDLDDLRWIWMTHADPDHTGALRDLIAAAPNACLASSFLGLAKLGLQGITSKRMHSLELDQSLDVGDRRLQALRPPYYDAPESLVCFDDASRTLFCGDTFGALAPGSDCALEPLSEEAYRQGLDAFTAIDVPWLGHIESALLHRMLDRWADLAPEWVLGSHIAPQTGLGSSLRSALDFAAGRRRESLQAA